MINIVDINSLLPINITTEEELLQHRLSIEFDTSKHTDYLNNIQQLQPEESKKLDILSKYVMNNMNTQTSYKTYHIPFYNNQAQIGGATLVKQEPIKLELINEFLNSCEQEVKQKQQVIHIAKTQAKIEKTKAAQAKTAAPQETAAAPQETAAAQATAAGAATTKVSSTSYVIGYNPKNISWNANSCWASSAFQAMLTIPEIRDKLRALLTSYVPTVNTNYLSGLIELYQQFKDPAVPRIQLTSSLHTCLNLKKISLPTGIFNHANIKDQFNIYTKEAVNWTLNSAGVPIFVDIDTPQKIITNIQSNTDHDMYVIQIQGESPMINNKNSLALVPIIENATNKDCTAIIEHQGNHWIIYVRNDDTTYYKLDDLQKPLDDPSIPPPIPFDSIETAAGGNRLMFAIFKNK